MKILFERKNVKKIFHSIRSDISVLKHCLNIQVNNVFDTQIAENIIEPDNINQISYKALIKYYLRDFKKKKQIQIGVRDLWIRVKLYMQQMM